MLALLAEGGGVHLALGEITAKASKVNSSCGLPILVYPKVVLYMVYICSSISRVNCFITSSSCAININRQVLAAIKKASNRALS